jgi:hypothetical protein
MDWYSEMMEMVDISHGIKEVFLHGSLQAKREVLSKLGSNLQWDNKILSIYNKESINKLVEHVKSIKSSYPGFELKNYVGNKALNDKNEPIDPVYYLWLPR